MEDYLNYDTIYRLLDSRVIDGNIIKDYEFINSKKVIKINSRLFLVNREKKNINKNGQYVNLIRPNNIKETGLFKDNYIIEGHRIYENGTIEIGTFKNNLLNGECKIVKPNNYCYEGYFVDGVLNGYGNKIDKKNFIIYEGEFIDTKMTGFARKIYSDGTYKIVKFKNDKIVKSKNNTIKNYNNFNNKINNTIKIFNNKKEKNKKKDLNKFYIHDKLYNNEHPYWNEEYYIQLCKFSIVLKSIDKIFKLAYDVGWEKKNDNNHYTFRRKITNNFYQNISTSCTPKNCKNIFYDLRKKEIDRIEILINNDKLET